MLVVPLTGVGKKGEKCWIWQVLEKNIDRAFGSNLFSTIFAELSATYREASVVNVQGASLSSPAPIIILVQQLLGRPFPNYPPSCLLA